MTECSVIPAYKEDATSQCISGNVLSKRNAIAVEVLKRLRHRTIEEERARTSAPANMFTYKSIERPH